nr:SNF2-related protein [uncultured Bacteroides sp.]
MIQWSYENNNFIFSIEENSSFLSVEKWCESNNELYLITLKVLVDNGFGKFTNFQCKIPGENIYELSDTDMLILGLPSQYEYDIYIQSKNFLNGTDFKYIVDFYTFAPGGKRLIALRQGPIIEIDDKKYILREEQYKLCQAIDEFNTLETTNLSTNNNFITFSNIKGLSKKASAILDLYLDGENVIFPDKIIVNLNYSEDGLEIIPTIDSPIGEKFTEKFDKRNQVKDIYPIDDDNGGRIRVVLKEEQKEQLKKIKDEFRHVSSAAQIEHIIEQPEQYLDSEICDLSEFYSDRVIEIGLYKPKFYPFVCPYKSEWIPGVKVVDRINGATNLLFPNETIVDEFENIVNIADQKGEKTITYHSLTIDLNDAKNIACNAREQLKTKKRPEQLKKEGSKVLIIEENAEQLGYQIDIKDVNKIEELNLYPTKALKDEIRLKAHQEEGIAWLQYLFLNKYKGCLLADDMGLGKTLQILYLIDWHFRNKNNAGKPYLIVAPISLLENWEKEYSKFFNNPKLPVKIVLSSDISKKFDKNAVIELSNMQIVLTNYETIRSCQFNFCAVNFSIVVLDEAQKIKTPGTLVTNASKALKSEFKIAMTGTPVENTLLDLWCIMDFSVPGLLGNAKEFATKYQKPLKDPNTDLDQLGKDVHSRMGYYFKRRLKKDVAKDLPQKYIVTKKEIMPKIQMDRYKSEINIFIERREQGIMEKGAILKSIMRIREISDHPYLVDSQIDSYTPDILVSTSAKLLSTVSILKDIKNKNEKVIIFAERRETQKMLQKIVKYYFQFSPSIINGDTPSSPDLYNKSILSRQQTIDYFQTVIGFNVIIMSPLAAGMGLNVTGANHVIHYSRHWNPAKEEQATDRAYRIGQTKDVYVYYPMAVSDEFSSFDETLDKLLHKKSMLASVTLFPTEQSEVKQDELYENIFAKQFENIDKGYTFEDLEHFEPLFFEAFTAAYYKKLGYNVILTPKSNDRGVDVIALGQKDNLLIQTKHSKNPIGSDGVGQICMGKGAYEAKWKNIKFKTVLFTNSIVNNNTKMMAETNNVICVESNEIKKFMLNNRITYNDVQQCEMSRMASIF